MRSRWSLVLIGLMMTVSAGTAQARTEVLPAGTTLNVRPIRQIIAGNSWVGQRVPGVVDDPVFDAAGRVVVPRGSKATLEVVGIHRRERVMLRVESIKVGRRSYPVSTNHVALTGRSGNRGRRTVGGTLAGATVGGLMGGGAGAAVGAATGGTTGAIAGSGRRQAGVGPESRLRFRLAAPVRVRR